MDESGNVWDIYKRKGNRSILRTVPLFAMQRAKRDLCLVLIFISTVLS